MFKTDVEAAEEGRSAQMNSEHLEHVTAVKFSPGGTGWLCRESQ